MAKDDGVIKPTTDLFIAALWSAPKNEPILRSLLSGVMTDIGLPPVVKATVLNPVNIQEFPVDKQIRLDVLVEDEAKTVYNIEVQTESHPGFFNRILYYWAELFASGVQRGEKYDKLRPVRSIVITEFPVFPDLEELHTIFEPRARENPAVLLSDHLQVHFLRLGNFLQSGHSGLDQLILDLQRWMQFWGFGSEWEEDKMSALLQDAPQVQQAYEEYKRFSADPIMREKAKARERFLIDLHLNRVEAEEAGFIKGEAKGRDEKTVEVAQNMKQEGLDWALIARITGLSLTEIERLN